MLKKLALYGFDKESLDFFKSYLNERKQRVQVESKISEPIEIGDIAVPQGSVMGGLFFIIFQNDFPANSEEEESILYADDDTDNVHHSDPDILENLLQIQANKSTDWISDNKMVFSGEKTKLLVVGTQDLRNKKLTSQNKVLKVQVGENTVYESKNEKLLGIIVSNDLTWKVHLYGNGETGPNKIIGLIPKLFQRVGILTKLHKVMSSFQFKNACEGMFYSKLINCLQLFANVFDINQNDDTERRFSAFTKQDNRRLQVLQNRILRLKSGMGKDTPTKDLLAVTGDLSVQQLTAYHTLMTVHRSITSGKPSYLAHQWKLKKPDRVQNIFPHRQLNTIEVNRELSISRGGTIYRGAKLWNMLPLKMRSENKVSTFKRQLKKWVFEAIKIKPN